MSGVRHVAIVGRDAAAWLAALGLVRAFRNGLRVTLVELPPRLTAAHAFSALPSIAGLNRMLGLRDDRIAAATAGVPVIAQRFIGWSGANSAFFHGYDSRRPSIGEVELLHYWAAARARGMELPYEAFSIAATAARRGKVPRPGAEPDSIADLPFGFHLSARSYVESVGGAALAAGITHHRAEQVVVDTAGARIVAVTLPDGTRIDADLFVDASGPEALLLAHLPGSDVEDWSRWLPCDRLFTASAPPLSPLPSFAQIAAFQAGWLGMFPLRDRTALVAAFDSGLVSPEEMARTAQAVVGAPVRDPAVAPFRAGARTKPWVGNCVALGEAAARLEPLDGVELHCIHLGLSHLIALFPVAAAAMPEAEAYNLVVGAHLRHIRDFQAAHYKLNARNGERFWDAARAASVSPELAHRIEAFAARGITPVYDDETFEPQSWTALFAGHGQLPRAHDPRADETPPEEVQAKFQGFLDTIAAEVARMPTVETWLREATAAPTPAPQPSGLY